MPQPPTDDEIKANDDYSDYLAQMAAESEAAYQLEQQMYSGYNSEQAYAQRISLTHSQILDNMQARRNGWQ